MPPSPPSTGTPLIYTENIFVTTPPHFSLKKVFNYAIVFWRLTVFWTRWVFGVAIFFRPTDGRAVRACGRIPDTRPRTCLADGASRYSQTGCDNHDREHAATGTAFTVGKLPYQPTAVTGRRSADGVRARNPLVDDVDQTFVHCRHYRRSADRCGRTRVLFIKTNNDTISLYLQTIYGNRKRRPRESVLVASTSNLSAQTGKP